MARREREIVAATEWLFETLISEKPGSVATTTTVIIRHRVGAKRRPMTGSGG
jgi:hypothetical protein